MTRMPLLRPGVLELSAKSVAVSVFVPCALRVMLKDFVPAASAVLPGRVAIGSLEVIAIVSVIVLTVFQLVSTALTVTRNGKSGDWVAGVPLFPEAVPGAADSPGTRSWSLAKGAGLRATDEEVALLRLPLVKMIFMASA